MRWRHGIDTDGRTFREYAYVTTEAKTGLDIVDLTDPDRPEKVQTWNQTFTSAHSLWIDEDRGLLFANGTTQGMRVLTLDRDPREPTEVGSFTDFYIHDSFTRGTTLYAAAINDGLLAILDVERPDRIREESRFLTGGRFTHNAWTTDDGRYLFTTDERRTLGVGARHTFFTRGERVEKDGLFPGIDPFAARVFPVGSILGGYLWEIPAPGPVGFRVGGAAGVGFVAEFISPDYGGRRPRSLWLLAQARLR